MGAAAPIGALRALDRFDLISWQGSSYPIVRAVLAGIGWWQGWGPPGFVAIWFVTDLGGDLFMWFLAGRELQRKRMLEGIRPSLSAKGLPGAWPFAIQVNVHSSLMSAWGPVARVIVGGLLGPASAALYRVASSLADSAQKPADLLAKAYYPEVVRMDLTTKHPWRLMLRGTAMASGFGTRRGADLPAARPSRILGTLFGNRVHPGLSGPAGPDRRPVAGDGRAFR